MATRVLLALAGVLGFFGIAWVVISLMFVRSVENGVSRHVIDGSGVVRGVIFITIALMLAIVAWAIGTGS